ncbi:MAG: IPT/TIG domain-containing protein [Acidobacteriota bacterium]
MPAITAIDPVRVVDGGRLWIRGRDFPRPDSSDWGVTIGEVPARVVFAAPDRIAVEVPEGLPAPEAEIRVPAVPGATPIVRVGARWATGLHQVDSPVFDAEGRLYVTYSGSRGQEAPVSIFRVTRDATREAFVTGIVNATSMAMGPDGLLHVSSRFDGHVYRVQPDGSHDVIASDLGQATGLAFGGDGALYVGDRSGTVFRIEPGGKTSVFATLPASVAAFHLAMSPTGVLYVSVPTLATRDSIYRIDANGRVEPLGLTFGRPQGMAFDASGTLYVVEALAGSSGVYRVPASGTPELAIAGARLIGVAFGPDGRIAVASSEAVYVFGQ